MIKIDGIEFAHAVAPKLKRNFNILDGENAGRLIANAVMERDVLGTFYNYTLTIDAQFMSKSEYDELYELLSSPVDSHMIEMPYGQDTITFEAYVTSGSDELATCKGGNLWGGLSINFVAIAPQRRAT